MKTSHALCGGGKTTLTDAPDEITDERPERADNAAQLARIERMERLFDASQAALCTLEEAFGGCEAAREGMQALLAYYASPLWRQDFDDDAAGRIPGYIKRGVLSEDAVYDLICRRRALLETMRRIADKENGTIGREEHD